MKRFIILSILALVFLTACGTELPPTPPPPGQGGHGMSIAGLAIGLPPWATEAKNIAVTPAEIHYNEGLIVSASNYDYVYKNGYFFNSKSRTWEKFTFSGEETKGWLKGSGFATINIDPNKFGTGANFLVVYACNKVLGKWDCEKWQLVPFTVLGSATGTIPESANIPQMVINQGINPFSLMSTIAEKDDFEGIPVIRYDARYRDPNTGLTVLVHVFDFENSQDLDATINGPFKDIVKKGWKQHMGHNIAMFLDLTDKRVAVWSSGDKIIYVETHNKQYGAAEPINAYLKKYPSTLKKP